MIKAKEFTKVGMVGYGAYVPPYRLATAEVARVWGKDGEAVVAGLGITQKAVPGYDEDSVTMAVAAAQRAILMAGIEPKKIGAVFMGSESHPYAVKPSGTIVADVLGMDEDYYCADLQFACKAGTAGIQIVAAMIEAGMIEYGLAIGSDAALGKPGDALEYTAGAGAAAFLLGGNHKEWLGQLRATRSFSSDTPDFWRRQREKFPAHGGRFTGEPAYFKHVVEGTQQFLATIQKEPGFFDQVVLHMPNVKFPQRVAKMLGIEQRHIDRGLIVREIGNPYSASSLLGLVRVLDEAGRGEQILMTAYGSGAGSDSFWWETTMKGEKRSGLEEALAHTQMIDYPKYLQMIGEL